MSATLGVSVLLALLAGCAYAWAARATLRRSAGAQARAAALAFAAWWTCLAATALLQAGLQGLSLAGEPSLALVLTQRHLAALAACVGVGGLLFYVAYLRWGRRGLLAPIAALYAAAYVAHVALLSATAAGPVSVGAWRVEVGVALAPQAVLAIGLVAGPALLAGAMLASLAGEARQPGVRRRGRLLAAAIAAWGGSVLVLSLQVPPDARALASQGLVLASALLVLLAHRPLGARPRPRREASAAAHARTRPELPRQAHAGEAAPAGPAPGDPPEPRLRR